MRQSYAGYSYDKIVNPTPTIFVNCPRLRYAPSRLLAIKLD